MYYFYIARYYRDDTRDVSGIRVIGAISLPLRRGWKRVGGERRIPNRSRGISSTFDTALWIVSIFSRLIFH
jgi:hypothetical protein